jgi:hypothetical protein
MATVLSESVVEPSTEPPDPFVPEADNVRSDESLDLEAKEKRK